MSAAPARYSLLPRGQELAMTCHRLAGSMGDRAARKCRRLGDELRGAAVVALVEAAALYEPDHVPRAKFSSFAHRLIRQSLHRDVKHAFRVKRDRRQERLTPSPPDRAEPAADADAEADDAFAAMLSLVPHRTAAFMRLRYADGLSLASIGQQYGVSKQTVCNAIRDGLAELRGHPAVRPLDPKASA